MKHWQKKVLEITKDEPLAEIFKNKTITVMKNLKINFTESDIQDMQSSLLESGKKNQVHEWTLNASDGTEITVDITVGDDVETLEYKS